MNKIFLLLALITSSEVLAADFTPYLGLGLGIHSSRVKAMNLIKTASQ